MRPLVCLAALVLLARALNAAPDSLLVVEPVLAMRADTLPPSVVVRTPRADTAGEASGRRFHAGRFYYGVGAVVAADAVVMVGLSDLWYTERVPFHWYADSGQYDTGIPDDGWLDDWHTYAQMDKGGHLFVAWELARAAGAYGRWSGLSDRKAGLFGATLSAAFQSQIELFDGFDPAYGASRTDLAANVLGAALGGAQVAYPERLGGFAPKLSYHRSPYYDRTISPAAPLNYAGNVVKDYDGLSYWLAVRPATLGAPAWWPRWLGAAVGYGADGLAHPVSGIGADGASDGPKHTRQLYLSLDLDVLTTERDRLPRALRPVAAFLSFVRVPFPALELGGRGARWHWLYY